jgi:hypothetical protein
MHQGPAAARGRTDHTQVEERVSHLHGQAQRRSIHGVEEIVNAVQSTQHSQGGRTQWIRALRGLRRIRPSLAQTQPRFEILVEPRREMPGLREHGGATAHAQPHASCGAARVLRAEAQQRARSASQRRCDASVAKYGRGDSARIASPSQPVSTTREWPAAAA